MVELKPAACAKITSTSARPSRKFMKLPAQRMIMRFQAGCFVKHLGSSVSSSSPSMAQ